MRAYTVVGAGAIGSSLAAHLAGRGADVTIVDADPAHVEAISTSGITLVRGGEPSSTGPLRAVTPEELDGPLERVLLATKSHHLRSALPWLAERLAPDGLAVVCQNGLGYAAVVAELGEARVVPALVNFAADRIAPGTIRAGGAGELVFGEIDGSGSARVEELREDFAGFGTVGTTPNIVGLLWSKRILAVLLTATAVADDDLPVLVSRYRAVMTALAAEAVAVARARGVRFEEFDGIDWERLDARPDETIDAVEAFLRSVPDKPRSGVFRDLRDGRVPCEASGDLDQLLGAARETAVNVPLLARLHAIIVDLEQGRAGFDHGHLDRLAAEIHH